MEKRRMLSIVILAFLLSSVFCAVDTSAQTLDIFFDQSWKKYYYIGVPATGGSFELSCMFHTNKNCDIYGQLPVWSENDFTDSTKFTTHFYLYDKNGVYQIKDLGTPIYNSSEDSYKTNYTEITGGIVYQMKIIVDIAAGISNGTYSGDFLITARDPTQQPDESGGVVEVALMLPVNATIVIDNVPPVIDEIYAYSGTKKVSLNGATLTEWAPTIRATYHDPLPGSGVKNVSLKIDAQSVVPDKWNSTELYYNIRAPLSEGTHTFTVNVTDYAGNSVMSSSIFTSTQVADTTPPTITYVSPSQDEILNTTQPTFTAAWHDNENGSGINLSEFQFAIDGAQYSVPSSDISDTGFSYTLATKLHNGPHWWSVQIKDYAGNTISRLINFTVTAADEFPPSSMLNIVGVDGWNIILGWTATDNVDGVGVANVTIYYAINSYHDIYGAYAWTRWQIFANDTTNAIFDASEFNIQTGDIIYFRSTAVDWNGNVECKWDPDTSIVFSPPAEENALNITVLLNIPTEITASSMVLSWFQYTDPDFTNYTIYQSTASGVLGNAIKVITTNTTTSWTVTGLSPGITYFFTVRVVGTGGLYKDSNQVYGTTSTTQEKPGGGWKFIPGFDAIIVIIGISGVALALKRRKR